MQQYDDFQKMIYVPSAKTLLSGILEHDIEKELTPQQKSMMMDNNGGLGFGMIKGGNTFSKQMNNPRNELAVFTKNTMVEALALAAYTKTLPSEAPTTTSNVLDNPDFKEIYASTAATVGPILSSPDSEAAPIGINLKDRASIERGLLRALGMIDMVDDDGGDGDGDEDNGVSKEAATDWVKSKVASLKNFAASVKGGSNSILTRKWKPVEVSSPQSPIFLFSQEKWEQIKLFNPSASDKEVLGIAIQMWKTAPEEEKKQYVEQSEKDLQKFRDDLVKMDDYIKLEQLEQKVSQIPFPVKLFFIVSKGDVPEISWQPRGTTFGISDTVSLLKNTTFSMLYPSITSWETLRETLLVWGFVQVEAESDDNGVEAFYHSKFLRGLPLLSVDIQENNKKRTLAELQQLQANPTTFLGKLTLPSDDDSVYYPPVFKQLATFVSAKTDPSTNNGEAIKDSDISPNAKPSAEPIDSPRGIAEDGIAQISNLPEVPFAKACPSCPSETPTSSDQQGDYIQQVRSKWEEESFCYKDEEEILVDDDAVCALPLYEPSGEELSNDTTSHVPHVDVQTLAASLYDTVEDVQQI